MATFSKMAIRGKMIVAGPKAETISLKDCPSKLKEGTLKEGTPASMLPVKMKVAARLSSGISGSKEYAKRVQSITMMAFLAVPMTQQAVFKNFLAFSELPYSLEQKV